MLNYRALLEEKLLNLFMMEEILRNLQLVVSSTKTARKNEKLVCLCDHHKYYFLPRAVGNSEGTL